MTIVSSILGFGAFGFAVRCWQLGVQRRNIMDNLGGHALSVGAWGTLGYFAYGWQERQNVLLAEKHKMLKERAEHASAAAAEAA